MRPAYVPRLCSGAMEAVFVGVMIGTVAVLGAAALWAAYKLM
jgi:hypothetical protein